jgi:hypothetical protein
MKTSATAPTVQIKIVLNHEHYAHFVSKLEQEGCNSLTEMFRKAIFNKWPLHKSTSSTTSSSSSEVRPEFVPSSLPRTKEEKNEEREKSPHTPLKRKKQEKKNLSTSTRARVRV